MQTIEEEGRFLAPGISEEAQAARRVFVRGEGARLWDEQGRGVIDFASGAFSNALGQRHPAVLAALHDQLDTLWNVHDFSTKVRLDVCRALAAWLPASLSRFVFLSTGAEIVEAALRVISGIATPDRPYVASMRRGFHGKTTGARELVHWNVGVLSNPSRAILCHFAYCYRCPFDMSYPACKLLCATHTIRYACSKPDVAALVFEPIQGAAGVIVPPPDYWDRIAQACRSNGVLLVADEFLTAGGRTGSFLACSQFGLMPDIVLMGKGLASGFPFSVLAGTSEVLGSDRLRTAGATSATYASHPFSLRAAEATLTALREVVDRVAGRGAAWGAELRAMGRRAGFTGDIRAVGLLAALEFVTDDRSKTPDPHKARRLFDLCLERGLKISLGSHIVRLAPPLNIPDCDLEQGMTILADALCEVCRG